MPHNPNHALQVLLQGRQQQQPQMNTNDPLELARLRGARADELRTRIPDQLGTPQGQRSANMLSGLEQEMEADSFTGAEPRQRIADIQAADLEAIQSGFRGGDVYQSGPNQFVSGGSPSHTKPGPVPSPRQQMGLYEQQQAQTKLEQPERMAQLEGMLGIQRQQSADEAAMARLKEQESGLTSRNQQMLDYYKQMGAAGGAPVSRVQMPTRSGGGSISFATGGTGASANVPPALLNEFKNARFALENSRSGITGGVDPALQANFDQSLLNVLQRYPAPMDVKQTVRFILNDPRYSQATNAQQAIQAMIQSGDITNPNEVTPQEIQMIDEMLALFSGRL